MLILTNNLECGKIKKQKQKKKTPKQRDQKQLKRTKTEALTPFGNGEIVAKSLSLH